MLSSPDMSPSPGKASRIEHPYPRGANDVLRNVGGHHGRTYFPRAMWTQTGNHPLKGDDDEEFDSMNHLAELEKEAQQDARMRKYVKDSLKKQLKERADLRMQAKMEVEDQARAVLKDVQRYEDEEGKKQDKHRQKVAEAKALTDSMAALARKNREAQEENARKEAREVRALNEKMKREDLKLKKQQRLKALDEFQKSQADLRQQAAEKEAERNKEKERANKAAEASQAEGDAKEAARLKIISDAQARTVQNQAIYEATAGKTNHAKEVRELRRIDKDEREHQQRLGELYARRERLREAQRLDMVRCLAEQVKERQQQKQNELIQTQVEARALEEDARRSLEEDLRRYRQKKEDQKELQNDLQRMMEDKLGRESGSMFASLGDKVALSTRMDASRFLQKPLGRVEVPKKMKRSQSSGKLSMTMGIMERDRELEANPWRSSSNLRRSGSQQVLRASH